MIYVGPIRDRPLGVWAVVSQRDLPKIGSVWVAFCAGAAGPRSAAELLKGAGASCRLAGSEAALDVELADQSEQRGELDDAINLLGQNRQKNVFYYAEYLFSRYQSVLEGNRHWPQLFSLIEDASTSPTLRSTLISDSEDVLSSGRELPLETQAGFARCLVHVVFLESDNQERENILGIDLRNWIRAVPGRELSAAEVFSDRLEEKAKLEAILATLTPSPELSAISGWLRGD
ncbi:MAG TPA: hypothetical protein VL354_01625 [Spirochaetia bacterium]|nr:hypothetical protein [Spirochaetia bacterium]